jgi:sensor histidine kinase YesM
MGLLYGEGNYSITIDSQENRGTTVDIRLPLRKAQEESK